MVTQTTVFEIIWKQNEIMIYKQFKQKKDLSAAQLQNSKQQK